MNFSGGVAKSLYWTFRPEKRAGWPRSSGVVAMVVIGYGSSGWELASCSQTLPNPTSAQLHPSWQRFDTLPIFGLLIQHYCCSIRLAVTKVSSVRFEQRESDKTQGVCMQKSLRPTGEGIGPVTRSAIEASHLLGFPNHNPSIQMRIDFHRRMDKHSYIKGAAVGAVPGTRNDGSVVYPAFPQDPPVSRDCY